VTWTASRSSPTPSASTPSVRATTSWNPSGAARSGTSTGWSRAGTARRSRTPLVLDRDGGGYSGGGSMIPLFLALADASPCEEARAAGGPGRDLGAGRRTRHGVAPVSAHRGRSRGRRRWPLDDTGNNNIYGQIRIDAVLDGAVALSEDHGADVPVGGVPPAPGHLAAHRDVHGPRPPQRGFDPRARAHRPARLRAHLPARAPDGVRAVPEPVAGGRGRRWRRGVRGVVRGSPAWQPEPSARRSGSGGARSRPVGSSRRRSVWSCGPERPSRPRSRWPAASARRPRSTGWHPAYRSGSERAIWASRSTRSSRSSGAPRARSGTGGLSLTYRLD
jgi:hypothetical protein